MNTSQESGNTAVPIILQVKPIIFILQLVIDHRQVIHYAAISANNAEDLAFNLFPFDCLPFPYGQRDQY